MPRGVYDRNKKAAGSNGSTAAAQDAEPVVEAAPAPILWKRIYEIEACDMPFEHPLYPLYRELRLRLENTPPYLVLVVVIPDAPALEPTLLSLRALFTERISRQAVEFVTEITPDGEALLYVRRGKGWKSRRGDFPADDD